MRPQNAPAHRIARTAARQHGVVALRQLLEAGFSREAVKRRARSGELHRVHRGVYGLGHPPAGTEARYMAAVLACGDRAALAGFAAAPVRPVEGAPAAGGVCAPSRRSVPGVVTFRASRPDATVYDGIPVTTVPRTIVDLAGRLELDALARACHEAEVRYRVGAQHVAAAIAPGAAGIERLREVYGGGVRVTLSALEREFLRVLADAELPLPDTNGRVGRRYVDCRWPERRLTVELDGYRYHHTRHAWELDRRREREARARGDEFRRYTWGDVGEDRRMMLIELRGLLGAG